MLLERYSNPSLPGGGHMVSAYHLDGNALVLTHYRIAKNQPTLRADTYDAKTSEIQFEFLRASNLASDSAGHMRRALYHLQMRITSPRRGTSSRTAKKTMTELEKFTRVR